MDRFQSKYFKILPRKKEMFSLLSDLDIGTIEDIHLFDYSSCSAVFCVDLTDEKGKKSKVVVRGEQQSGLVMRPEPTYSLEKEILVLKQMAGLGLNVPKVLQGSRIFSLPGYDESGAIVKNFRFFLMSYVEGIAVDKKMQAVPDDEKLIWLDKIATILAKVHAVTGREYGFVDEQENPSFQTDTVEGFLNELHSITVRLLKDYIGDAIANEVDIFMKENIPSLSLGLEESGYAPHIRLVLFDGSAGNMLVDDEDIQVLDMVNVGFFEPVTDFCAHFFCMKDIFVQEYKGKRFWDHFLESYRSHGGELPQEPFLLKLFHIINVYFLCDAVVGYKTHLGPNKREKTDALVEVTRRVMALEAPDITDIANAL